MVGVKVNPRALKIVAVEEESHRRVTHWSPICYEIDHPVRGSPVLGRKSARLDLKFLNGFHAGGVEARVLRRSLCASLPSSR